ncbi:MAG: hypothetical protein KF864_10005 [Phycisphaeraceae bacterium]|nr:hypothetical protein [Phycisphaeraceae bacterium]
MGSPVKVVALVLVVSVGALVGYQIVVSAQSQRTINAQQSTSPPPGAVFVEYEPEGIVSSVASARRREQREEIASYYEGLWVPDAGWEHEVVDVTPESLGTAVRMFTATGGITGGYYTVAVFPTLDQPVKKGDRVRYQGEIKRVEVLPTPGVPTQRILLHNCRLISVTRM